jgi:large subunit ribosomal protein L24
LAGRFEAPAKGDIVQTTLLGLAIAFILALLAALIGPYFVDWNQFKPRFEVEASRVLGAPVRVEGALDARLLPTPTLRLRKVGVGKPNDPGRIAADKLDVEFSLGALMRGDWRASELTIDGLAVNAGLDERGRIIAPPFSGGFNIGGVSIDRLNLTGKVGLYDTASRTTIALDDISFSGDVRAQAGSVRGEGQLSANGERYPFRLSTGQSSDGNGTRFRFGIEPGARPFSAYLDGVLTFAADAPQFEGALSVVRTASLKSGPQGAVLQTPWKMTANVRAEPSSAKLEQVELAYGSDETAVKLNGVADVRFGASPLLHVVLAARQLDADRLLAKEGATSEPAQIIAGLRDLVRDLPQPPLPVQAEVGVDQIMLGGRPMQGVGLDLSASKAEWRIDKFEMRAPGATQVVLSGTAAAAGFKGAISIDSADPDLLATWMQGRNDAVLRGQRSLRVRGQLNVTADRVALDGMSADLGSGELRGKLGWVKSAGGGSRIETDLTTHSLDLDATIALARAAMNAQGGLPSEGSVKLAATTAKWAGQELKPFAASFAFTPKTLTIDTFSAGAPGGMQASGGGAIDFLDATGKINVSVSDVGAGQIVALLLPFAPELANRIQSLGDAGRAKIALTAALDKAGSGRGKARVALDIDGTQIKTNAVLSGSPRLDDVRAVNVDAMARDEWTIETKSIFPKQAALLGLIPLGEALKALSGSEAVQLDFTATGALRAPLKFKATVSGAAIDASAEGSAELWPKDAQRLAADAALTVRRANLAPLLDQPQAINISLTSRLTLSAQDVALRDIDSRIGSSRVRGRLSFGRGDDPAIDGELGMDVLDLGAVFSGAIGANGRDPAAPLGRGLMRGWRGQVTFQALRGVLPGGIELRPVGGALKTNGDALSFHDIKGKLGGSDVAAEIDARPGLNGLGLDARLQFANADASALRYRGLAMPAGRASLQMTLASRGRSASGLSGALSGAGSFTLEKVRIPGLDPAGFDAAIRAGDAGQPTDATRLKTLLEPVLAAGAFAAPSAQIAFVVSDGRLRVGATTLEGEGARAVVSGGYDIAADQVDMRALLMSTALPNRPEILVLAHGTPDAPVKTLDVTSLSSWLAVRAIDRETRRLDAIERGEVPPPPVIAPAPPAVPAVKGAAIAPPPAAPRAEPSPDLPVMDVPTPGRDPRRAPAKAKVEPKGEPKGEPKLEPKAAPRPVPPPQTAIAPPIETQPAPALPPPIDVKPAPGQQPRPASTPRPRQPLVLTPQFSN